MGKSQFLCYGVCISLNGRVEYVADSLTIFEVDGPNDPIDDHVFHVPIDESNHRVRLTLIWMILFINSFNNCILAIIIENKKVSGSINLRAAVNKYTLKLGIPFLLT